MQERELWNNTVSCLETELSKGVIGTFFAGTELLSLHGGEARIVCPNKISADYLRKRYLDKIAQTLSTLTGEECRVRLEIRTVSAPPPQDLGPIFRNTQPDGLVSNYNFDNFVVGIPNQLAANIAKSVVEHPGGNHNPLFIYSGVGLGKTHLIHAIGNSIKVIREETRILYTSSEQFTNEFIRSIQNGRSAATFRKKFRTVDVLMVDDVQFFTGREGTQEEFFNTFNELHLAGKQVILTSDKHPNEIQKLDQRLTSRFCGGVVVDIQEPDMDMRLEILRRKARERGATVQDDVLLALAEQISGSIRNLEGMLNQILAISAAQKIIPTRELACSIIKNNPQNRRFVSPAQVVQTVCRHFGVEIKDVESAKRNREIVLPRQVAAYVLKNLSQLSLQNIGDLLGGRDHTTILHGIEKIEQEIKTNEFLKNQIQHLRVEILGKTSHS